MHDDAKSVIRSLLPPILLELIKPKPRFGFFGDYPSWDKAEADASGYTALEILAKVRVATLKVAAGEAACERDSVVFDTPQYSWPLAAMLMWLSIEYGNKLNLVDFGGSLGSSYYQNRVFLQALKEIKWNIVEQPHYVECGRREFQNGILRFHHDLESCLAAAGAEIVLFSSVLQYLPAPFEILNQAIKGKARYIIVDRMPFHAGDRDRITVQTVPDEIFKAKIPSRFFGEKQFLDFLESRYRKVFEYESTIDGANIPAYFKGFLFKLK